MTVHCIQKVTEVISKHGFQWNVECLIQSYNQLHCAATSTIKGAIYDIRRPLPTSEVA